MPDEEDGKWYSWRVKYWHAGRVHADLCYVHEEIMFPIYFAARDILTDENGVFDVDKVETLIGGEDSWLDKFRDDVNDGKYGKNDEDSDEEDARKGIQALSTN